MSACLWQAGKAASGRADLTSRWMMTFQLRSGKDIASTHIHTHIYTYMNTTLNHNPVLIESTLTRQPTATQFRNPTASVHTGRFPRPQQDSTHGSAPQTSQCGGSPMLTWGSDRFALLCFACTLLSRGQKLRVLPDHISRSVQVPIRVPENIFSGQERARRAWCGRRCCCCCWRAGGQGRKRGS